MGARPGADPDGRSGIHRAVGHDDLPVTALGRLSFARTDFHRALRDLKQTAGHHDATRAALVDAEEGTVAPYECAADDVDLPDAIAEAETHVAAGEREYAARVDVNDTHGARADTDAGLDGVHATREDVEGGVAAESRRVHG